MATTHYVYWKFDNCQTSGVSYALFNSEIHNHIEKQKAAGDCPADDYTLLHAVSVDEIDADELKGKNIKVIAEKQCELQHEINKLEEEMQQLLFAESKG